MREPHAVPHPLRKVRVDRFGGNHFQRHAERTGHGRSGEHFVIVMLAQHERPCGDALVGEHAGDEPRVEATREQQRRVGVGRPMPANGGREFVVDASPRVFGSFARWRRRADQPVGIHLFDAGGAFIPSRPAEAMARPQPLHTRQQRAIAERPVHQQNARQTAAVDLPGKRGMPADGLGRGAHDQRSAAVSGGVMERIHPEWIDGRHEPAGGIEGDAHVVAIKHAVGHRPLVPACAEIPRGDPAIVIVDGVADQDAERVALLINAHRRPRTMGPHADEVVGAGRRQRRSRQGGKQRLHAGHELVAAVAVIVDEKGEVGHA